MYYVITLWSDLEVKYYMKVMVVDDSMLMRKLETNILTIKGHSVVAEASNGLEALKQYKRYKPDLVFMDITMAVVNGIDGVKLIKAYDPKAMIIMCSSMGQENLKMESFIAGAFDFVIKPFKASTIQEVLSKVESARLKFV